VETKQSRNPEHGCLHKALVHEPMFILLGRDPAAPAAIRRWVKYRSQLEGQDRDQLEQAEADALLFAEWREAHDGEWRDPEAERGIILIPSDEVSSLAGRILGRPALDETEIEKLLKAIEEAPDQAGQIDAIREALAPVEKAGHSLAGFVLNSDPQAGPNG
jgi:hypothetical protein